MATIVFNPTVDDVTSRGNRPDAMLTSGGPHDYQDNVLHYQGGG